MIKLLIIVDKTLFLNFQNIMVNSYTGYQQDIYYINIFYKK